jgi:predicted transcriptional regulator
MFIRTIFYKINREGMFHILNWFNMPFRFRYRDRSIIVMDILNTIQHSREGKTKTNIMRGANLNYEQVKTYLDVLLVSDLIRLNGPRYRVTTKGLELANELQRLSFSIQLIYRRVTA